MTSAYLPLLMGPCSTSSATDHMKFEMSWKFLTAGNSRLYLRMQIEACLRIRSDPTRVKAATDGPVLWCS